jgi:hypothetical protein
LRAARSATGVFGAWSEPKIAISFLVNATFHMGIAAKMAIYRLLPI